MAHLPSLVRTAATEQRPSESRRQMILFRVAGQAYGLPMPAVSEILPLAELAAAPNATSLVLGFLNLEGNVLPVIPLARLFGLEEQPLGLYSPLLILHNSTPRIALLVDAVSGIITVDAEGIAPVAAGLCWNDSASGLVAKEGEHVLLLDEGRLLGKQVERRLAELTKLEQTRLAQLPRQEAAQ